MHKNLITSLMDCPVYTTSLSFMFDKNSHQTKNCTFTKYTVYPNLNKRVKVRCLPAFHHRFLVNHHQQLSTFRESEAVDDLRIDEYLGTYVGRSNLIGLHWKYSGSDWIRQVPFVISAKSRVFGFFQKTMDSVANHQFKIILGSSSVARKQILADMGFEFTTMSADIDEKAIRTEKPEELVMVLAEAKAEAIVGKLQSSVKQENNLEPTLVIAADTVVVYEGMIREKPCSKEEARQFIQDYSGGCAATVSSVLVTNLKTGVRKGEWDKVEIHFHNIPEQVIDSLIEEGMVLNVAGGLIIEHPLILPYVKEVVGGTDSVMGLPKALTRKLMDGVL